MGNSQPKLSNEPIIQAPLESETITFQDKEYNIRKRAYRNWKKQQEWALSFNPSIPLPYMKDNGSFVFYTAEGHKQLTEKLELEGIPQSTVVVSECIFLKSYGDGKTGELPQDRLRINLEALGKPYLYSCTFYHEFQEGESTSKGEITLTEILTSEKLSAQNQKLNNIIYEGKQYEIFVERVEKDIGTTGRQVSSTPSIPLKWFEEEQNEMYYNYKEFSEQVQEKTKELPGDVLVKRCCFSSDEELMQEKENTFYLEIEIEVDGKNYTYTLSHY